jgi:hypothetical protein
MKKYGGIVGKRKVITVIAENEEEAREKVAYQLSKNRQRRRIKKAWELQGSRVKEL